MEAPQVQVASANEPTGPASALVKSCKQNFWVPLALVLGLLVGAVLPVDSDYQGTDLEARVSQLLGWTYFFAWSISFYPQVFLNCQRRSVVGLSLDYQLMNVGGFLCYFIFNFLLYTNDHIKQEYRDAHDGNSSSVQLNDVFFGGHALLLTLITVSQIVYYYDYPPLDKPGLLLRRSVVGALLLFGVFSIVLGVAIAATSESFMTWLTFISILAEGKVAISVVKYCPQVLMNYQRKSTVGWNIYNVLLDFTGGLLSVAQLVLDAVASSSWTKVTGNPAKFLLGNLSMIFDVIFMVQHYCLYKAARIRDDPPLMAHAAENRS